MSGTLSRLSTRGPSPEPEPRVLEVGRDDADAVLNALSSGTSRNLLEALYDEPATPSEAAERVDTSLQNVNYHFEKLEAAGLVEPVDTVYSDRGHEMTVYGPTSDPIVLVGEDTDDVQGRLAEVAGGVGLLALAGLAVQVGVERFIARRADTADVLGPASAAPATGDGGSWLAGLLFGVAEPGVLFFLGGLVAAAAAALWLQGR